MLRSDWSISKRAVSVFKCRRLLGAVLTWIFLPSFSASFAPRHLAIILVLTASLIFLLLRDCCRRHTSRWRLPRFWRGLRTLQRFVVSVFFLWRIYSLKLGVSLLNIYRRYRCLINTSVVRYSSNLYGEVPKSIPTCSAIFNTHAGFRVGRSFFLY